jgi:RNA polymerase sigma factor (sigma-70 family)
VSDTDALLVERCRSGDRSAFAALVAVHLPRMHAIAVAVVHDPVVADDVVQETFLKAWTRLGQLTDPTTFAAWTARITRNEAISVLRRSRQARSVPVEEAMLTAPNAEEPDPRFAALRTALVGLKPEYREILALRYDANLDYEAISATLGITRANVEKRLYRARQALLSSMSVS